MVVLNRQSQQPISPWVFRELGLAALGDARLTARALRLASDCAAHPDLALASIYEGDWAGLKAGYRFLDNPKVTPAKLLAPHQAATWERCASEKFVLIAQDTTYLNFTRHTATTGLGPIGSGSELGLLLHSALALTTDGVPLGLVAQIAWARDPETPGKSAKRKQLPIEDKESYRWLQIQEQVVAGVPAGTQTVLMGDRESDIYDLFIAPRDPLQHLLVRGAWDRKLADPPEQHLWAAVEAVPMAGTMTITVPRKPGQREREATLELRTTGVQFAPPAHRRATTPAAPPITVVLAREIAPPEGIKPIEWLLLTTLTVVTVDDARRIVTWYSYRWRIERLHFTHLEKRRQPRRTAAIRNAGSLGTGHHPVFDCRVAPLVDDLPSAGRTQTVAHRRVFALRNRGLGTPGRHAEPRAVARATPDTAGRGAGDGQTGRIPRSQK